MMDRRAFMGACAGALSTVIPAPRSAWADAARVARAGESYRYSVGWRGLVGAHASLVVDEPSPGVRRLTADVENTALLRFIFRIRDRFQVLQSAGDGSTQKTFLWQNENGTRRYREETFLEDRVVSLERNGGDERTRQVTVDQRPLDPLGTLFWLRAQDLSPGRVHAIPLFANNQVFESRAHVLAHETLKAAGHAFDAVRISATFHRAGREVDGVRGTFWLSADARRLPLKVQADTTYGPVAGNLQHFVHPG